jgi:O-antigen/teichoic acid export membrane protein
VNADAVILNRVSTSLSLATYRIADRVSRLFDFTGYSIAVALFPSATRAHLEDRSSVKGPLRFAIRGCAMQSTLLVVLAALVWVAGQPALQLVFGDQYADAASITALLLLSYIPVTWAQPLTFLSLAKNRLPSVTAAYGVTLAIAVVANLFAARLGAAGCAMVALGTRSLVCLLLLVGFLRTS